jgi:hypothetical protein
MEINTPSVTYPHALSEIKKPFQQNIVADADLFRYRCLNNGSL